MHLKETTISGNLNYFVAKSAHVCGFLQTSCSANQEVDVKLSKIFFFFLFSVRSAVCRWKEPNRRRSFFFFPEASGLILKAVGLNRSEQSDVSSQQKKTLWRHRNRKLLRNNWSRFQPDRLQWQNQEVKLKRKEGKRPFVTDRKRVSSVTEIIYLNVSKQTHLEFSSTSCPRLQTGLTKLLQIRMKSSWKQKRKTNESGGRSFHRTAEALPKNTTGLSVLWHLFKNCFKILYILYY